MARPLRRRGRCLRDGAVIGPSSVSAPGKGSGQKPANVSIETAPGTKTKTETTMNGIATSPAPQLATLGNRNGGSLITTANEQWRTRPADERYETLAALRDAVQFARAEEGRCESLWDLINGFTASARSIEFADARIELESRAGKLMSLAK